MKDSDHNSALNGQLSVRERFLSSDDMLTDSPNYAPNSAFHIKPSVRKRLSVMLSLSDHALKDSQEHDVLMDSSKYVPDTALEMKVEPNRTKTELIGQSFPMWGIILLLVLTRVHHIGLKQFLAATDPAFEIN